MIPILYDGTETQFQNNGVCRLIDCVSCVVTEERNGIFECEFTYPVTGRHYDLIKEGMIIFATHDDSGEAQPFDIYKRSVPINGIVTFNASHISYRLRYNILNQFETSSCAAAIAALAQNSITPCLFTFTTTKNVAGTFSVTKPVSIKEILVGEAGSILDVYGTGEYTFDKWSVSLDVNRGVSTPVEIRYGKNLVTVKDEKDSSGAYNAVIPYWASLEDGSVVVLPERILYAQDYDSQTDVPMPIVLNLSDRFETEPTETELRTLAQSILDNADDREPYQTIEVDFVNLGDTLDYKDVAPLQQLNLCDTVVVFYPGISAPFRKKITKTVYNVLLEKYDALTLGNAQITLTDTIRQATERDIDAPSSRSVLNLVTKVTAAITGNSGGYVTIKYNQYDEPEELLILCDSKDYTTATKLWRWNSSGLGYSSTGYNGTYSTAISSDGYIVANAIGAGIISANDGYTFWNLNDGEFYNGNANRGVRIKSGSIRLESEGLNGGGLVGATLSANITGTVAKGATLVHGNDTALLLSHNTSSYRIAISEYSISGIDTLIKLYEAIGTMNRLSFYHRSASNQNRADEVLAHIRPSDGLSIMTKDSYPLVLGSFAIAPSSTFPHGHATVGIYPDGYSSAINNTLVFHDLAASYGIEFYRTSTIYGVLRGSPSQYYGSALMLSTYTDTLVLGRGAGTDTSLFAAYIVIQNDNVTSEGHSEPLLFTKAAYFYSTISCTTLTQRSDDRLKDYIEWDERYDQLFDALDPRVYHWKDTEEDTITHLGLSAQSTRQAMDVLGIKDGIAIEGSDGIYSIDYKDITMLAVKRIKDQEQRISDLEARLAKAEAMIEKLTNALEV